jgi:hypothetical protein
MGDKAPVVNTDFVNSFHARKDINRLKTELLCPNWLCCECYQSKEASYRLLAAQTIQLHHETIDIISCIAENAQIK